MVLIHKSWEENLPGGKRLKFEPNGKYGRNDPHYAIKEVMTIPIYSLKLPVPGPPKRKFHLPTKWDFQG